jgi:hypothetical protein
MIRVLASLALLLTLAACDSEAKSPGVSPGVIAGHWSQETSSDQKGMTLEFDDESDKMIAHTAPDADGAHDHLHGTYSFDKAAGAVTVRCELSGKGKGDSWSGKLEGDALTLTAGASTLRFRRGTDPHQGK